MVWGVGVLVGLAQTQEVVYIPEVVERLVGVLDGDLADGGLWEEVGEHGGVEVGAVASGLEGWEDEELGDALAGGEGGGELRVGEV